MSKIMNNDARSALRSIVSDMFGRGAEAELMDVVGRAYRNSIEESIRLAVRVWANEMADELAEQAEHRGVAAPEFIRMLRTRLAGLADLAPQLAQLKQRGKGRFELWELIAPAWAAALDHVGKLLAAEPSAPAA